MTDLVQRLRHYIGWRSDAHRSECHDLAWPKPDDIQLAEEAANEIERLQRELATMELRYQAQVGTALEHLRGKQDAQAMLAEARRYAFFVGWEMCETASAEDTCADAWAFWSMMEDGRDEAEGSGLRTKAEETQG